MSLENSPVSRLKQSAVIKLHCLLTAVSFSFALLPSSLVALSSPAYAQPITISAKNFNSDAAGILIAAKGPDEVKAPSSSEVSADSEASESKDKDKDKTKIIQDRNYFTDRFLAVNSTLNLNINESSSVRMFARSLVKYEQHNERQEALNSSKI